MTQDRAPFSPGLAAVMSFFIPGLGQMCQGKYIGGIAWLIAVPLGYVAFVVPGIVLHLICIVHAARG